MSPTDRLPVATVISISGDRAVVQADADLCPRCAAGRGCGAGVFGRSRATAATVTASLDGGIRPAVGERVTLALQPSSLIRAAACVYGLPLFGLLAAVAAAYLLTAEPRDGVAIAAAIAGLLAGGIVGRSLARRSDCIRRMIPVINGRARESAPT